MTLPLPELLIDLAVTFPGINAQALTDEPTALFNGPRAWFDQQITMPDEYPLFILPDQLEGREPPGYTGRVHDAFIVWLARRGWQVFPWPVDGAPATHLLVPTATLLAEAQSNESDTERGRRSAPLAEADGGDELAPGSPQREKIGENQHDA